MPDASVLTTLQAMAGRLGAMAQSRLALMLVIALAFTHLPSLLLPDGHFADDWSYVYLANFEGAQKILRLLWDNGHPLYGPGAVGVFAMGEAGYWLFRTASFALHGLNAYLLLRLLARPPLTSRIAPLAAALFLVSPFYSIRGPAANSVYDPFVTAWLLSVLWMDDGRKWRRLVAPVLLPIGMSVEPMVMLEPLRMLYVGWPECRIGVMLRRVGTFWCIALAVLALRLFVYAPSGHYAGVHPIAFDVGRIASELGASFRHVPESLKIAGFEAWHLVPLWQVALFAVLAAALFWRLVPPRISGIELAAIPLGIVLFALAAFPYALIGEHLWPYRFESRFALVAQIGAIVALVATIQSLPVARLRWGLGSVLLMVSALAVAGDGKWLHLDRALQRDISKQLIGRLEALPQPVVLRLAFDPPSHRVLYRYRCLGGNDLNVPLALADRNRQPRTYVYDTQCGDLTPDRQYCTVSYFDRQPCPVPRLDARFDIDLARSTITTTSLWDALGWTSRTPGGRLEMMGASAR